MIFVFDGDLAGDVFAAEGFVGRKPFGGVLVEFFLVGRAVDSEEIERILAEIVAGVGVELVGTGSPRVAKGNDMVDLDGFGGFLAALELDSLASIGVVQGAGLNFTALEDNVSHVAVENDFAHAAAAGISAPLFIKEFAVVFLLVVFGLDGEVFEDVGGFKRVGDGLLGFESDIVRFFDIVAKERRELPGVGIEKQVGTKSSYQEQNHKEAPDAIGDFLFRHN